MNILSSKQTLAGSLGSARVMVLTASDISTVSEIIIVNREAFEPERGLDRNTDISNRSQDEKSSFLRSNFKNHI